jgi:hypothetical protein
MTIHSLITPALLGAALLATIVAAPPPATAVQSVYDVDVAVVGGTPAGVTAALAAIRLGATVVLVADRAQLGGVITSAWLTTFDMNLTPAGEHLTQGIFLEFFDRLGISFDPDEGGREFGRAVVHEPGLRAIMEASLLQVHLSGSRITAMEFLATRWRRPFAVRARLVVDATDDGDVAALAGAPYVVGRPGYRAGERWVQAATLIFRVDRVNWRRLADEIIHAVKEEGSDPRVWGVRGRAAWGFPWAMAHYRPADPLNLAFPLNLARQRDGSILINSLNLTGVDGLDPASVQAGMARARAELPRLMAHLRAEVPWFERARLVEHAPALYIRETRHIAGLYTLTADDVTSGRVFEDRIAVASYPIDIHPYYVGWTNPYTSKPRRYTIPFRTIVPRQVDNLLIASRAFSATSEAHGSARVIPTLMSLGQAAGVTAALCAHLGCMPRQVADDAVLLREVQRALILQGAYLGGQP